nr:E3 binding domain-containing protein [Cyclobacteriaceae bacterium]
MAQVELIMPKMGESIMEATILNWLKKPGDKIEQDESVLEVATDKVDTEVPSTHAGVLKEILAKEGDVVKVGKPIAILVTDVAAEKSNGSAPTPQQPKAMANEAAVPVVTAPSNGHGHAAFKNTNRFYSPLVKSIAKQENIAVAELEAISGSGMEGRVTKKDILAYVQQRKTGQAIARTPTASATPRVPASISAGDEIIQMDRMRKMIAERMV